MVEILAETMDVSMVEKQMDTKQNIEAGDEYILQDNRDLEELERRYEKLDLPYAARRVIDDYIACLSTRDERYAQLCYLSGVKTVISHMQEKH